MANPSERPTAAMMPRQRIALVAHGMLLPIAAVGNTPVVTHPATADYLISSPLVSGPYDRKLTDYHEYLERAKSRGWG